MNPPNGHFRGGSPPFRGGSGRLEPFRGRGGMMPSNHRGGMMMGRGPPPRRPPGGRGRMVNGRRPASPPLRHAIPRLSRQMNGPFGRGGPPTRPDMRPLVGDFRGGPAVPFGHNPPPPPPLPRRCRGGFGPGLPPPPPPRLHAPSDRNNNFPMAAPVVVPPISLNAAIVPLPPPTLPAYTKDQLDASWTEHTAPDGKQYYYNSLSKESIHTRPAAFAATPGVVLPTAAAAASTINPVCNVWTEYTDISSGKTYYSNGVTTQWTRPEELGELPKAVDAAPKEEYFDDAKPRKKRKRDEEEVQYESKEEAAVAFNEFLISKDVATNLKWSELRKMFSSHGRWEAIGKHLSTGERRQALAEYQTKRQNELKTLERQERQKAKDNFSRMLADVLPTMKVFSAWNSNWSDVRQALSQDDRFKSIHDESSRETLFVEFCEEFRKREGRRRRAMKREAEVAFVSFLKDRRKAGRLSLSSTFHMFQASLSDEERKDGELKFLEHLEENDQQRLFTDFITETPAAEEEQRRHSLEEQRIEVKELRATFYDVLVRLAEQSKLTPSSLWRDSQTALNESLVYSTLLERDPGAAREIFQMFMDGWNDAYLKNRSVLSQLVGYLPKKACSVTSETTYGDFVQALSDVSSGSQELAREVQRILNDKPISSAKVYFDELKSRAASAARRGSTRRVDVESSDEGEIFEGD